MRLRKGEHAVLGYFASSDDARAAAAAVRALGVEAVQVDRVARYGVEADSRYNNPLAGEALQNSALAAHSAGAVAGPDSGVLVAADPSVSGTGMQDYGAAGGAGFLLTVVTSSAKLNQVVRTIQGYGGRV